MRKDQREKIETLSVDLMDVFLTEAAPENWSGAGVEQSKLTPDLRGARNWDMKNANQAGALLMRALDLRDRLKGGAAAPPTADDPADADVAKFEKQARALIDKVNEKRRA